jgi:hypothetical protein
LPDRKGVASASQWPIHIFIHIRLTHQYPGVSRGPPQSPSTRNAGPSESSTSSPSGSLRRLVSPCGSRGPKRPFPAYHAGGREFEPRPPLHLPRSARPSHRSRGPDLREHRALAVQRGAQPPALRPRLQSVRPTARVMPSAQPPAGCGTTAFARLIASINLLSPPSAPAVVACSLIAAQALDTVQGSSHRARSALRRVFSLAETTAMR